MSTSPVPAPGVECVPCLAHGHHAKAIEYVDELVDPEKGDDVHKVAMCLFHRDGESCPGCDAKDNDRVSRSAIFTDFPRVPPPPVPPPMKRIDRREDQVVINTPDPPRRQGHSKLVVNKETKKLDTVDPHPENRKEKTMPIKQPPIDDATVARAIELRRSGFSTSEVARKLSIKPYRLYQCVRFMEQTRNLSVQKNERTANKARSQNVQVKVPTGDISLQQIRDWASSKIAALQEVVTALDKLIEAP